MYGLVLSGGLSTRMGKDKGEIIYPPSLLTQRERGAELLKPFCQHVFISCRADQQIGLASHLELIFDEVSGEGPGVGILSAHQAYPNRAWFVLACDFPYANEEDLAFLHRNRSVADKATCFTLADGLIEPFFTIWEPEALRRLQIDFQMKKFSPRKTLAALGCKKVQPLALDRMKNVND